MEYKNILFEVADGVAMITINRPKALNALNSEVMCELYDAAVKCKTDEAIKAVIITARARSPSWPAPTSPRWRS